ncbi:MAG: hypothetical protein ACI8S6_002337 [Myxococcota bacterium]|jgi:hypothetical protein
MWYLRRPEGDLMHQLPTRYDHNLKHLLMALFIGSFIALLHELLADHRLSNAPLSAVVAAR